MTLKEVKAATLPELIRYLCAATMTATKRQRFSHLEMKEMRWIGRELLERYDPLDDELPDEQANTIIEMMVFGEE